MKKILMILMSQHLARLLLLAGLLFLYYTHENRLIFGLNAAAFCITTILVYIYRAVMVQRLRTLAAHYKALSIYASNKEEIKSILKFCNVTDVKALVRRCPLKIGNHKYTLARYLLKAEIFLPMIIVLYFTYDYDNILLVLCGSILLFSSSLVYFKTLIYNIIELEQEYRHTLSTKHLDSTLDYTQAIMLINYLIQRANDNNYKAVTNAQIEEYLENYRLKHDLINKDFFKNILIAFSPFNSYSRMNLKLKIRYTIIISIIALVFMVIALAVGINVGIRQEFIDLAILLKAIIFVIIVSFSNLSLNLWATKNNSHKASKSIIEMADKINHINKEQQGQNINKDFNNVNQDLVEGKFTKMIKRERNQGDSSCLV